MTNAAPMSYSPQTPSADAPQPHSTGTDHVPSPNTSHVPSSTPSSLATPAAEDGRLLLIWDSPNMDMGLGSILGGRPDGSHRPRFDALGKWLLAEAGHLSHKRGHRVVAEPTVFANIVPGGADAVRPWVEALRNIGFAVFAKPKLKEDTDVDPDMIEHLVKRFSEGTLDGVIVASADGRNFKDTLEDMAVHGVAVTVLGFHEHATWAIDNPSLRFVDVEDIPGVFRAPLPRVSLDNLPEGGAWLPPLRSLSALLYHRERHERPSAVEKQGAQRPTPGDIHTAGTRTVPEEKPSPAESAHTAQPAHTGESAHSGEPVHNGAEE